MIVVTVGQRAWPVGRVEERHVVELLGTGHCCEVFSHGMDVQRRSW